jgi:protocatechuate 3,4-dioxygenase beta subunit
VVTRSHDITDAVVAMAGTARNPRLRQVMPALLRHLHDFAREVGLRPDELFHAAEFLTACGQISDASRHEFLLLFDTLGLTMAVDTETSSAADGTFESSVLGPYYRADAPFVDHGANLDRSGGADGDPVHVSGRVVGPRDEPVPGAVLDVWSTNSAGLYENVDPAQPDMNLRGRLRTRADGSFEVWTVKPVPYPIPADGPAGELLAAMDRHNMRPAHLHVIVSAPGFRTVVSELFTGDDPYLDSDVVFGVKPSLVVDYNHVGDPVVAAAAGVSTPFWTLHHQFVLAPGQATHVAFSTGSTEAAST